MNLVYITQNSELQSINIIFLYLFQAYISDASGINPAFYMIYLFNIVLFLQVLIDVVVIYKGCTHFISIHFRKNFGAFCNFNR